MKSHPKRKVTLVLDEDAWERIRAYVSSGRASSQSGLVQEAVTAYLDERDRESLRAAYAAAASDPAFLEDVHQVMRDFAPLDDQLAVE